MTMSEESIQLACDAGVPVLLAATRRAAPKLERLAEDLLVAGAEVEIVSDVEHAPARFGEALVRLDRPAVIALCHTHDDIDIAAVRAMLATEPLDRHRVVECHVDERSAIAARTVMMAMRDLARGAAEPSLAEVIDEVRKKGEPITETIVLPPKPAVTAPKKRRNAWAWGAGAAAMAATTIIALVLATDPPAQTHGADAMAATTAPATSTLARTQPAPTRVERPQPPATTRPLAIAEPLVVTQPPAPKLELEAQGPTAGTPDDLDVAIRRGRAIEVGDLVAHMVTGDRDWFHAMDTCRGRGFWGTSGWRAPTVAELRAIARTRSFPDRPAWSTRRGANDALAAVTVTLVGGATETVDKHAGDIATICVKSRA